MAQKTVAQSIQEQSKVEIMPARHETGSKEAGAKTQDAKSQKEVSGGEKSLGTLWLWILLILILIGAGFAVWWFYFK